MKTLRKQAGLEELLPYLAIPGVSGALMYLLTRELPRAAMARQRKPEERQEVPVGGVIAPPIPVQRSSDPGEIKQAYDWEDYPLAYPFVQAGNWLSKTFTPPIQNISNAYVDVFKDPLLIAKLLAVPTAAGAGYYGTKAIFRNLQKRHEEEELDRAREEFQQAFRQSFGKQGTENPDVAACVAFIDRAFDTWENSKSAEWTPTQIAMVNGPLTLAALITALSAANSYNSKARDIQEKARQLKATRLRLPIVTEAVSGEEKSAGGWGWYQGAADFLNDPFGYAGKRIATGAAPTIRQQVEQIIPPETIKAVTDAAQQAKTLQPQLQAALTAAQNPGAAIGDYFKDPNNTSALIQSILNGLSRWFWTQMRGGYNWFQGLIPQEMRRAFSGQGSETTQQPQQGTPPAAQQQGTLPPASQPATPPASQPATQPAVTFVPQNGAASAAPGAPPPQVPPPAAQASARAPAPVPPLTMRPAPKPAALPHSAPMTPGGSYA